MAVKSVVNFSTIKQIWRFDAEYWHPIQIENEQLISRVSQRYPVQKIYDLVKRITGSAFYPSIAEQYSFVEGIPFIRVADIGDFFIKDNELIRIPEYILHEIKQIATVRDGDIVIAKGGSIGGACLVQPGLGTCAVSRDVIAVRTDESKIDSSYLVAFLKSKFGQLQLDRYKSQQVQAHLTFPAVGNVKAVVPPRELQHSVANLITESLNLKCRSKALYAEAEALLLHELGLDSLDLSPQIAHTACFSEAMEARRLDAEYFQPKYYRVKDAIKALNPRQIVPLGDLLDKLTNGHTPRHHDLSVGDIPFLTAEHVFDFRINFNSEKRILTEHHEKELKRTQLREGDILITIKGRIGNAAIVEHLPGPTNINQDVALLRLKSGYNSYYVVAFLNSLAGKALIDQICTGQINPFLGLGNLSQISIPLFDQGLMDELGEKIRHKISQAYQVKIDAELLLEEGKMRVEKIILNEV